MTHVERAGGVRRHELHVERAPVPFIGVPIVGVLAQDFGESPHGGAGLEPEIDEARASHVRLAHAGPPHVELRQQITRDVVGLPPQRPGECHGEIGRPVAECGVARALHHGVDGIGRSHGARRQDQLLTENGLRRHSLGGFPEPFFSPSPLPDAGLVCSPPEGNDFPFSPADLLASSDARRRSFLPSLP